MPDDELTLSMLFLMGFLVVLSLFISWYFTHDPKVRSLSSYSIFMLFMNNGYAYQLDAIPTVGFTDPILSYFSALQFSFDGVRMLREGYKKVIHVYFSYMLHPSLNQTDTFLPKDKTRFIQNCQFSEMDGTGFRF